jgi:hypothetical protein
MMLNLQLMQHWWLLVSWAEVRLASNNPGDSIVKLFSSSLMLWKVSDSVIHYKATSAMFIICKQCLEWGSVMFFSRLTHKYKTRLKKLARTLF